jgi:hypothetical protein
MKKILFLSVIAGSLLVSCNNNKPKPGEVVLKDDDGGTTTVNMNALQQAADNSEKKTAELAKLKPYTTDEIKAFFPEELMGMKRTEYAANAMMGFASGSAEYKKDDSTRLKLELFDCAGEAGSAFYGLQYLAVMQTEKDSEDEYIKTTDFNGGRAIETVYKKQNRNSFVYFGGDRLMVTLTGENIPLSEVKSVASKLALK